MKIYEKSVRNPISTIMIFVGVAIIGLFSMTRLSIDLYPDMDIPYVVVITVYGGASAADVESNVSIPLENSLTTVQNLKTLRSISNDNMSVVMMEFEWGTNLDEASNEIRDKLSLAERNLPDDADNPMILKINPSMLPILMLSVTAEESFTALSKMLEDKIINPLNRVDGVGEITILGALEREIQVNLDPAKMEAFNLTVEQIGQLIATENINIPAGSMNIGSGKFSLSTKGEFSGSDRIANLSMRLPNGTLAKLSDIASVKDTVAERTINMVINGNTGVMLMVQKQSGANTVAIAKTVLKELEILKKDLPHDVEISVMNDSSEFIQSSINSLAQTVMFAFIFVTLVVLFFIGNWRTTFIIALTIPVSLLTGFIYLLITGGSLNIISLSALVIALTLVVDDAIVVIENITKHIEKGSSPREASIYGTNEVWLAVIATTFTLIAVFFPLTLVGGIAGIMFKPFGWIVCIVTTISTIAGITLTPMLASKMLKFEEQKKSYKGLGIIYKPIDKFLGKLDNGYAQILTWAVRHRTTVLLICLAIFASSILLLKWVPVEFMPKADDGQLSVTIELEQSRGLEYTQRIAAQVTEHVQTNYPEMERISTNTSPAEISVTIKFVDATERKRDIFTLADELRDWLHEVPSIVNSVVTTGGGMGALGGSGDIEVKVFGHDFDVSETFARELQEQIRQIEGTRDVQLSRREMQPELRVVFDQEKLAMYGLNTATAGSFLRNRVNGMTASKFREDGDEFDIVVRFDEPFRRSVEDIENILFMSATGHRVRVKDVGVVEEFFSPPSIQRENRQRSVSISMSLHDAALGDVVPKVQRIVDEADIPYGVSVTIGGTAEQQAESFGDIGLLLVLVVVLVYIVMATQFESLRMPFIIMFTLPFAFTGVFVALFLTGTPLSLIALIGSVMLVGIVVKNGIVLVDFTNLQCDRGLSVNQAVITAGKSRLRPVLITSLTTILGLMPLAIGLGEGSETWQPMGIAIIGGMTVSTALTLIVVPVLYSVFGTRSLARKRKRIIQADEN